MAISKPPYASIFSCGLTTLELRLERLRQAASDHYYDDKGRLEFEIAEVDEKRYFTQYRYDQYGRLHRRPLYSFASSETCCWKLAWPWSRRSRAGARISRARKSVAIFPAGLRSVGIVRSQIIAVLIILLFAYGNRLGADEIDREASGNNFPIAKSVFVPANAEWLLISGNVPPAINRDAPNGSLERFGDVTRQTEGVLTRIKKNLEDRGWSMGDVVMMRVYLTADPTNGNKMNYNGFMKGYAKFFGTEDQPNLPARAVVEISGLANAGWLVEIEVQAARMPE